MATTLRNDAKNEIMKILREQGYPTYAKLVSHFDIYLTDDPNVIGYMVPDKAKIVLNAGLSINQVSTIIRHEILHEYLDHAMRRKDWETKTGRKGDHQTANIAMDYEISNRGYTDADKLTARSIILGDQVLRGLVTEDQYPGWENKTFEEMYDELLKQREKDQDALKQLMDQLSKLSQKDLEDLMDDLDDASGDSDSDGDQDNKNNDGKSPGQQKASDLADELEDIADELGVDGSSSSSDKKDKPASKGGSSKADNNNVFDSKEEQERKKDLAKRVAEIKRQFNDLKTKGQIDTENKTAIDKEKAAKAARNVDRVISSPLSKFRISLDRFIADQLAEEEEDTYSRIHPSYEDSEFIKPGRMVKEEKNIPRINVYWDVSGSFSSPQKTEGARKAIATLNKYVREGDIVIDTFYFADRVSETKSGAGGGTNGRPIQEHIAATKPTNVIIITDSDISDCSGETIVPGAVWMLFYDSQSQNLIDHVKGKRETRHYLITNY